VNHLILFALSIFGFILSSSFLSVFAGGTDRVGNLYFSANIPDNWIYIEARTSSTQNLLGFAQSNLIVSTPKEFSEILFNLSQPLGGKINEGGLYSVIMQDSDYQIKNAPLDLYAKYRIDQQPGIRVISKENVTIDSESAIKIYSYVFNSTRTIQYVLMHDNEPYLLVYAANGKDFEKYLPEFEQIVKSFKFTK
jgi:PsbP-like protein